MSRHTPIGVDIGSHSIKIAQLAWGAEGWVPTILAKHERPGTHADENPFDAGFIAALKSNVDTHRLRGKRAVITAPADRVEMRPITAPLTEGLDLAAHVISELSERTGAPAGDFVVDFWIAGEVTEHGESKLELYSVSAPKELITSMVKAVEKAGLICIRVEVAATALAHAISHALTESSPRPAFVVDIGDRSAQLLAVDDDSIRFCRYIKWGGRNIIHSIRKTLNVDNETAAEIMVEWGLRPISQSNTESNPDNHPRQQQINDCIEQELRKLALEIGRSLSYRARSSEDGNVTQLGIVGGLSYLRGFNRFIKDALKVDVKRAAVAQTTPTENAQVEQPVNTEPVEMFGVAVGAALAGVP